MQRHLAKGAEILADETAFYRKTENGASVSGYNRQLEVEYTSAKYHAEKLFEKLNTDNEESDEDEGAYKLKTTPCVFLDDNGCCRIQELWCVN